MPVSEEAGGNEAPRPEFMVGLDVTARWELLSWCDDPVPEPDNDDGSLRPPTKMSATVNPKLRGYIRPHSLHRDDGEDAVLPPRRSICEPLEAGEEEEALGFPIFAPRP